MAPLPKRRFSHGRTRRRRAHDHLTKVHLVECSFCHVMRLPHTVCSACGHYRGKAVLKAES